MGFSLIFSSVSLSHLSEHKHLSFRVDREKREKWKMISYEASSDSINLRWKMCEWIGEERFALIRRNYLQHREPSVSSLFAKDESSQPLPRLSVIFIVISEHKSTIKHLRLINLFLYSFCGLGRWHSFGIILKQGTVTWKKISRLNYPPVEKQICKKFFFVTQTKDLAAV